MASQPTDPFLYLQWYLDASGHAQATVDLNVRPVWADYSGRGVHVGVLDSLVEASHADLAANYDASLEVDGLEYGSTASGHGTSVAGIIAAAANGEGIVGVAHGATLTSLPVIFSRSIAESWLALAMPAAQDFDVVNMSYGGTLAFEPSMSPETWASLATAYTAAADQGRDGRGTVLVTASGNNRAGFTDANLSHYQTERHAIVVGATDHTGTITDYSSEGANVFVVAPSSAGILAPGITTTDRSGIEGLNDGLTREDGPVGMDYTTHFGGTSSAAPMVSGIAALLLEANPALGWRDVRDILAISARHTGTAIGDGMTGNERFPWQLNGASQLNGGGFHVSNDYGFGLVDALAAVRLAETWSAGQTSANELLRRSVSTEASALPDGDGLVEIRFVVDPGVRAETVTLFLDLTHPSAREIEVALVSPDGTESRLFHHRGEPPDSGGNLAPFRPWTFTANTFRGEDASGTWTLRIADTASGNAGTVQGAELTVYGDAATTDDTWFYTDEFGALAGVTHAAVLRDTDGSDTLDAAAITRGGVRIDLRQGGTSLLNGTGLQIAAGSVIEHAIGTQAGDRIGGNAAGNHLQGARGNDVLDGRAGNDSLAGGRAHDVLIGGGGNDVLDGGAGNDRLRADAGADTVTGGGGNDVFAFPTFTTGDDRILDFHPAALPLREHDRIDLRAVDAIAGGSDEAFVYIGTAEFSAPGQLRAWFDGRDTLIAANTRDDPGTENLADWQLVLAGSDLTGLLGAGDFLL